MIQHMGDGEPTLVTAYLDYDGEGNARRVRDPMGQETTLAYDDLGRLTDATYPQRSGEVSEGVSRLVSTRTEYDGGDYVTRVTETRAPFGTGATFEEVLEWDHDAFGRLTRHGQRGRDVTYTYNDSLRQMAQASSGGSTLYQYDELGRIDWAELDGDQVDVSYVTHEDLVSTVTNPNGTSVAFEYDAATRRLTGLEHRRGGTAFLGYEYAYDHNGNRTLETVTEGASTERNVYAYDALDRMTLHRRETGVNPAPSAVQETRYEFELGGERGYNRRVEVVQDGGTQELARRVYDYDGANRLTELSETGTAARTVSYEHDANGNRLSRVDSAEGGEQTLYRYTALDQLTEVLHGAPGAEVSRGQYEYDATGRRVRQRGTTRGDVETVYDGLSTLDELDITGGGAGTPLAHYHYALGLARLDEGGGEERYYHLDGRGNTGALTAGSGGADAPGDLLTSYRLDPFGAVRSGSDPVNRQLYTGHETDTETGLIYMNARHYDPETGRFVTQDSWMGSGGDPGTQNRYAYALGNPATYWDPTGHAPEGINVPESSTCISMWGGCGETPQSPAPASGDTSGGSADEEEAFGATAVVSRGRGGGLSAYVGRIRITNADVGGRGQRRSAEEIAEADARDAAFWRAAARANDLRSSLRNGGRTTSSDYAANRAAAKDAQVWTGVSEATGEWVASNTAFFPWSREALKQSHTFGSDLGIYSGSLFATFGVATSSVADMAASTMGYGLDVFAWGMGGALHRNYPGMGFDAYSDEAGERVERVSRMAGEMADRVISWLSMGSRAQEASIANAIVGKATAYMEGDPEATGGIGFAIMQAGMAFYPVGGLGTGARVTAEVADGAADVARVAAAEGGSTTSSPLLLTAGNPTTRVQLTC